MLKKRILASSMASVMALGSVSVAAFAEDATKAKDYGEAVTKTELKAFVEAEEDFIADELSTYGSKQGDRYQAAYDHALKVLDDEDADAADYTAAYQMMKAVKSKLTIYTSKQLQALIDDNKSKYDKNNEFNEDLQDNIYTEDSYSDFASAYDDALRYVDEEDSMLVTDAYVTLDDAVSKLSELKTVTKSEFRTALKAYEELTYKMKDYETWRRGTLTVAPTTGTSKNKGSLVSKAPDVSFIELIDMVYGTGATNNDGNGMKYWDGEKWNSVKVYDISLADIEDGHNKNEGTWIGSYDLAVTRTFVNLAGEVQDGALYKHITECYKTLDDIKGATVTSNPDIVAAYEAAVDAVNVFNGWKVDSYKSGSKSSCASLIKKYRPQLVETFNQANIDALVAEINYKEFDDSGTTKATGWYVKDSNKSVVKIGSTAGESLRGSKDSAYTLKQDKDDHTLKCNKALYIIKEKDSGLMYIDWENDGVEDWVFAEQAAADTKLNDFPDSKKSEYTVQKISANTNILGYMSYTASADQAGAAYDAVVAEKTDDSGYVIDDDIGDGKDSKTYTYKTKYENYGPDGDETYYAIDIDKITDDAELKAAKAHNVLVADIVAAFKTYKTAAAEADNFAGVEEVYHKYLNFEFPENEDEALGIIDDYADGKTISKASGSSTEWTLIWRKLAYTLEDMFPVNTVSYSLSDLKTMIDRAYDACEATGDSNLFYDEHVELVDLRQDAQDWYKEAKSTTGYKTEDLIDGRTLTTVYAGLKDATETLEKWLKDFKYSYGEIGEDIAKIATAIDNGDVKGSDELKAKLAECAYDLSVLDPSWVKNDGDEEDNLAFDSERVFQPANRLKTGTNKCKKLPNDYEKDLLASYEALKKAYDTALKGDEKPAVRGDVDGDGVVTFDDVSAVVTAFLLSYTDSKYDVNEDGVVDFEDVSAAVDLFLKA